MIAKCCFGASFLIVPSGFKTAGLLGGPLVLIVVYIFLITGMLKLIDCRIAWGSEVRFIDMAEVLGYWGNVYVTGGVGLLVFGFACVWCLTCATNLGMIFPEWSVTTRIWVFLPFVAPLSFVRRLKFFTITNLIAIVLALVSGFYMCGFAIQKLIADGPQKMRNFNTEDLDSLLWFGACGYIFELIVVVVPIYEAAADKPMMPKLLIIITFVVVLLYIAFGFLFYAAFGEDTEEMATLNLPIGSFAGKLFPLFFALVGVATNPINILSLAQLYEPAVSWSDKVLVRKWQKNFCRLIVTIIAYTLTWLGGDQLQNFLALVGGLLGANLSLVVPCLLHLFICKPVGFSRIVDYVTIVFGAVMMVVSTYQTIVAWK